MLYFILSMNYDATHQEYSKEAVYGFKKMVDELEGALRAYGELVSI